MNSVLKMIFFFVVTFILVIFVIIWWDVGAVSSFLVYQSYFHGMSQPQNKHFTLAIIKAQEKIKKLFTKKIHFTPLKGGVSPWMT